MLRRVLFGGFVFTGLATALFAAVGIGQRFLIWEGSYDPVRDDQIGGTVEDYCDYLDYSIAILATTAVVSAGAALALRPKTLDKSSAGHPN